MQLGSIFSGISMACDIFVVSRAFRFNKFDLPMNEIEFVDAVSRTPLSPGEKKDYFSPPKSDPRKSELAIIFIGSVALVIFLISWAFS
jgi:hypothetical protein